MALLIDIKQPVWMRDEELRDALIARYPGADIRVSAAPGNLADITMLAVSSYEVGESLRYPNLKLIQKTGAGVEAIVADTTIPPDIAVARLKSETPAQEIAEFSLACVLQEQRHLRLYREQQAVHHWSALAPRQAQETTVAVLGLGMIGTITAQRFFANGFQVIGWSRSAKKLDGITCYHGADQFGRVLGAADYVVSILPATPETENLFNHRTLAQMKPAAWLINVGRGSLIDESALMQALDAGLLGGAILDVMQAEPLPVESPMWLHPKIILTPHVSGWHLGDAIYDIGDNLRRLEQGEPLLHLVNRTLGY